MTDEELEQYERGLVDAKAAGENTDDSFDALWVEWERREAKTKS